VRIFRGEDVRRAAAEISGHDVSRKSPVLGLITLLLDALKGSAAVVVAIMLSRNEIMGWSIRILGIRIICGRQCLRCGRQGSHAALFAILGHMFPVW